MAKESNGGRRRDDFSETQDGLDTVSPEGSDYYKVTEHDLLEWRKTAVKIVGSRGFNSDAAEDVVQDAVIKFLRYTIKGHSRAQAKTFFIRCVNTMMIDHARKKSRRTSDPISIHTLSENTLDRLGVTRDFSGDDYMDPVGNRIEPYGEWEDEFLTSMAVDEIMSQLHPSDQELVTLRAEGLTTSEISAIVGRVGTGAKNRLLRIQSIARERWERP